MVKAIYKPLGLVASVLGGVLAGAAFKQLWQVIGHEEEAPKPTDRNRRWTEVLLGAAAEGAVFGLVKAAVDRAGATGFAKVTGAWPGDD